MQEMIMKRLGALLAQPEYTRVLGWEQGEFFYDRTPKTFTEENLDQLKYDDFCGSNVAKYLIDAMNGEGKVIALLKPCDSYSLNQLCTEHRVDRDRVYAIGVGCRGKLDVEKLRKAGIKGITAIREQDGKLIVETLYGEKQLDRKAALLDKCLTCKGKEHRGVDETLGESEETTVGNKLDAVAELEAMSAEERFGFWRSELSKCIRCNACRNVCPACSCIKCVFDNPAAGVANKAAADDFEENMFHLIRAYHVAGRCTDCGECSRVCPQGIPLHLLNRKLIKDINGFYGDYQAGESVGQRHPLIDFTLEDAEAGFEDGKGGKRV